MKTIIILLLAAAVIGCAKNKETTPTEIGAYQADPQKVPKDRTLQNPVPLVGARFEASDAGYVVTMFKTTGVPSTKIDVNRDVVIKAFDEQGKLLDTVSVDNPRDVRTVGANKPAQTVRPKASFTVFFANPDAVRSFEVNVVNGANAGYKQSFAVNPRELKPLEEQPPTNVNRDVKPTDGNTNVNK
jgi:hypothetical protein